MLGAHPQSLCRCHHWFPGGLSPLSHCRPFHLVTPLELWRSRGALSPTAACLACSLWTQVVVGGLLPATLLWAQQRQAGGAGRRGRTTKLLDRVLGERPLMMTAYAAQLLWLILRTTVANFVP